MEAAILWTGKLLALILSGIMVVIALVVLAEVIVWAARRARRLARGGHVKAPHG